MTASILYDNRFLDAMPVASSTAAGFDVRNINDLKSFTYWKASSGSAHTIVVDCGSAKSADTVAILSHNLFSIGGSFSVEYSSDNFTTSTTALATFFPDSNNLVYQQFTSASARYWRITISGSGAFIAVAMVGVRFTFDTEIEGEFSPGTETIKADHTMTRYGDVIASTSMVRMMATSVTWGFMLDASFRAAFKTAWDAHLSLGKPFFIATDYANNPRDAYFYRIKSSMDIMSGYNFQNRRAVKLDMIGVADYGNGYAAVNAPGWVRQTGGMSTSDPLNTNLGSISWNNTKWIVGSRGASKTIFFNSNSSGTTWTPQDAGTSFAPMTMVSSYVSGVNIGFVGKTTATGYKSAVATSINGGSTWTFGSIATSPDNEEYAIAYGNGAVVEAHRWAIFGVAHGSRILVNSSEIIGARDLSLSYPTAAYWTGVRWVVLTDTSNDTNYLVSTDNTTWTALSSSAFSGASRIVNRIAGTGSFICAVGSSVTGDTSATPVWVSNDHGLTWALVTTNLVGDAYSIVHNGTKFYIVGYNGVAASAFIASSVDAVTWALESFPAEINVKLRDIAWNGTNQLCISGDLCQTSVGSGVNLPLILTKTF